MHFIDFIIILLFAGALYRGYKRGLLLELTGFLALIPAFWVAANFSRAGASLIAPYAGRGLFLPFLGFLFIFLIVLFGTRYLMKFFEDSSVSVCLVRQIAWRVLCFRLHEFF